jgi:biofilm protein TabA
VIKSVLLASLFFLIAPILFCQQPSPKADKKLVNWETRKPWAKGLKIRPHISVNQSQFYKEYNANQRAWDTAFGFLRTQDLAAIPPGKYPLLGDSVFVTVSEAATKPKDSVQWESHRKYIDLQYIYKGKELVGVADASKATVTKPYSFDAMNYNAEGKFYVSDPQTFFLFFPNDAHRPSINVPGYGRVKKFVIKVLVSGT